MKVRSKILHCIRFNFPKEKAFVFQQPESPNPDMGESKDKEKKATKKDKSDIKKDGKTERDELRERLEMIKKHEKLQPTALENAKKYLQENVNQNGIPLVDQIKIDYPLEDLDWLKHSDNEALRAANAKEYQKYVGQFEILKYPNIKYALIVQVPVKLKNPQDYHVKWPSASIDEKGTTTWRISIFFDANLNVVAKRGR